jgi:hypothetical protein
MRRRHNIAHHSWGIAYGLELKFDQEGSFSVGPGLAIDGYGRELVLVQTQKINTQVFEKNDSDVLDVWLLYNRLDSDLPPSGYTCYKSDNTSNVVVANGTDKPPYYRSRETTIVQVEVVQSDTRADARRKPPGVSTTDYDFGPEGAIPDDPTRTWRVFLGQLRHDPTKKVGDSDKYSVDPANRPYVGLVGNEIRDPAQQGCVTFHNRQSPASPGFAVYVKESADPSGEKDTDDSLQLEIYDRDIHLNGDTTIQGDLTIQNGFVGFQHRVRERFPNRAKERFPIWGIYRCEATEGAAPIQPAAGQPTENKFPIEELRISMAGTTVAENGVTAVDSRIVIGFVDANQNFQPCLTVYSKNDVTVHGNLQVEGELKGPHVPGFPSTLSPEAKIQAKSAQLIALNTISSINADRAAATPLAMPTSEDLGVSLNWLQDTTLREKFTERLKTDHADTLKALRNELCPPIEWVERLTDELGRGESDLRDEFVEEVKKNGDLAKTLCDELCAPEEWVRRLKAEFDGGSSELLTIFTDLVKAEGEAFRKKIDDALNP